MEYPSKDELDALIQWHANKVKTYDFWITAIERGMIAIAVLVTVFVMRLMIVG